LDRRRDHPARADAVAPHHERLLGSVLVEKRRLERHRVAGAELEDVPDLDRRPETKRAAAVDAAVALDRDADVGESRLEVATGLHAAEMLAGDVRADDELPFAQRLVGDDVAPEADGADRAGV